MCLCTTYKKRIHIFKCDGGPESQTCWLWDIQKPNFDSTRYEHIKQRSDVEMCKEMTSSEQDG